MGSGEIMEYYEKLLPVHPKVFDQYAGPQQSLYQGLYEALVRYSGILPPEKKYTLYTSDKFSIAQMGSNPLLLQFLEILVRIRNPKSILEIGTFVGVSAMALASGVQKGGRVVTVEKFDHFAEIARKNFSHNGFQDRITLLEGDAFDILPQLKEQGPYDFVFLDGNKERYADYFTALDPIVEPGGVFIVDDSLFHGDVLNAKPQSEKGRGVLSFLQTAEKNKNYFKTLLPIGNGFMLMLKLR